MPRLIDMDIEPFLLVASLNAIAAQRLVRKICDNCKIVDTVPESVISSLKAEIKDVPEVYFEKLDKEKFQLQKGKGCEKCDKTGYKGRLGIFEVLPVTQEIKNLVLDKAPTEKILDIARNLGMISMRQDGIIKVMRGETTLEEVARVSKE